MRYRSWALFFGGLFLGGAVHAQLRQIDPEKLPQDEHVKSAYLSLLPVEPLARAWSPKWAHDTPKEQVVSLLKASLHDLNSAEIVAPENEELFLLTGLVAHLAHNVDVEGAYETAVQSLEAAHKLAPGDYRTEWFLGIHRCQSLEIKEGMEQFLAAENQTPWQRLPVDFWDDYINCSTISIMPAHTLRAVDRALQLGAPPSGYYSLVDIAHKRYKTSDAKTTYLARDAWQAFQGEQAVQFTSQLCGIGFSAHNDWHIDIRDVAKGICVTTIETGTYPSKTGRSTPTLLVLTRPAKTEETLADFVQTFVKKYPEARQVVPPSCPADKCVGFEIVTDAMYQPEGGAHLLVLGFAGQPTDYPGLLLEKPDAPPKSAPGDKVTYYHPTEKLHRFPGVLYTVLELDSNQSIFENAATDFRFVLRSILLD